MQKVAQSAEPCHNLIGDIQHIVLVTDLTGPPVITHRRHNHATGTHNGLSDKARHIFRPEFQDFVFKIANRLIAKSFLAHAIGTAVSIRRRNVMHQVRCQIKSLMIKGHTGHRHGKISTAMVAVGPGYDLLLIGLTQTVEVIMNDSDCRIIRHRSTGAQEHMIQGSRGQFGQFGRQRCRGRCGQMIKG